MILTYDDQKGPLPFFIALAKIANVLMKKNGIERYFFIDIKLIPFYKQWFN